MTEKTEYPSEHASDAGQSNEIASEKVFASLESELGHGWKRRLAKLLDVPESNVHGWIKAGRMPSWALRTVALLRENRGLKRDHRLLSELVDDHTEAWHAAQIGDSFDLYEFKNGLGRRIASSIPSEELAKKLASFPRLKAIGDEMASYLREALPDDKHVDELIERWEGSVRFAFLRLEMTDAAVAALDAVNFEEVFAALDRTSAS